MTLGMIFWLLMILVFVFGAGYMWAPNEGPWRSRLFGGWGLVLFILLFLLGWKTFGFVIQDDGPRHSDAIHRGP
jgi:uncharacterized membrane protein YhhN